MRKIFAFAFLMIFVAVAAQAVELKILPKKLNPNGSHARMKAEIRDIDVASVDLASFTLEGIPALRTRTTPKKIIAFFPKNEVVAGFGEVSHGDVVELTLSFSGAGGGPTTLLTAEVTITGKKKGGASTQKKKGGPPTIPSGAVQ